MLSHKVQRTFWIIRHILIAAITTNTQGKDALKVKNFRIVHSHVPEFTIQAIHSWYNTKKLTNELRYVI